MKLIVRLAGLPIFYGAVGLLALFLSMKVSVAVSIDFDRTSSSVPLVSVHRAALPQQESDLLELAIIVVGTVMLIQHLGRKRS